MRELRVAPLKERTSGRTFVYLVATALVALDQLTKAWAVAALDDGSIEVVDGLFRLHLTRNPGAAFSILQGSGVVLGVVAAVTIAVIAFIIPSAARRIDLVALGLIMGGAAGNLLDRVFRGDGFLDGAVIDFLDLSFWPTFNVADSGITIGVVLVLVSAVLIPAGGGKGAP